MVGMLRSGARWYRIDLGRIMSPPSKHQQVALDLANAVVVGGVALCEYPQCVTNLSLRANSLIGD